MGNINSYPRLILKTIREAIKKILLACGILTVLLHPKANRPAFARFSFSAAEYESRNKHYQHQKQI
jgi:hypothetical protein